MTNPGAFARGGVVTAGVEPCIMSDVKLQPFELSLTTLFFNEECEEMRTMRRSLAHQPSRAHASSFTRSAGEVTWWNRFAIFLMRMCQAKSCRKMPD